VDVHKSRDSAYVQIPRFHPFMMVSPAASYKSDDNSLELRENTSNSLNPSICEDSDTLLVGTKLIAVIVGLSCCVFCTSLDNTIVATAIPKIAADFQSVLHAR
jgi:hypothetical protein